MEFGEKIVEDEIEFDSKETEEYFYEQAKKYGIIHVTFTEGDKISVELIDQLLDVITKRKYK